MEETADCSQPLEESRPSSPDTPALETADPGGGGGGEVKGGVAGSRSRRGRGGPEEVVDGPWAWVVTAATFVVHFILYGFIFVAGMYFVVFLETFGRSSSMTSWISSLYLGTLCSTGPIAGVIINKWGCRVTLLIGGLVSTLGQFTSAFAWDVRPMYFTFGLLTGFGHGLFLMAAVVALNMYFRKYRVLALGVSLVGTAAGNIIYPYLTRYLLNNFGWRGALIITSGINLQCCVAAMFVRPLPKTANQKTPNRARGKTLCQTTLSLCTDVHYWLLCASNATFVFGMSVFITHIAAFAQSVGIGKSNADHLMSSLGIAALIGRGATALVAHHKNVNVILFLVFCYIIAGVAMVFYGVHKTFAGLLLSVLVYGLFSATNGSVSVEYASYVIGSDSFATGYGYVMFYNGLAAVSGAPVAGLLYDMTQFYPSSFYLSGGFMMFSGLLMFPTYLVQRRHPVRHIAASMELQVKEGDTDQITQV